MNKIGLKVESEKSNFKRLYVLQKRINWKELLWCSAGVTGAQKYHDALENWNKVESVQIIGTVL